MTAQDLQGMLSIARQAVTESQQDAVQSWMESFCRDLPSHLISETPPEQMLTFLLERYAFFSGGLDNEVKVAVGDPDVLPEGLDASSTVIETRMPDCAWIVSTVKTFVRVHGLETHFVVHPLPGTRRDGDTITVIDPNGQQGERVSHVYMLVSQVPPSRFEELRKDLQFRLSILLRIHREQGAIESRVQHARSVFESLARKRGDANLAEGVRFIDWLRDGNFHVMGYAFLPADADGGNGAGLNDRLGLLAIPELTELAASLTDLARVRLTRDEVYLFYRLDDISPIRSEVALRYVGVKEYDDDDRLMGEHAFVGLYSTRGMQESNKRIPVMSSKMDRVMRLTDKVPGTHAYKRLFSVLDSIPGEDLFYSTDEELRDYAEQTRDAEARDQARVIVRRREGGNRISITLIVPRSRYSEALRERVAARISTFLGVDALREYVRSSDDESPIRLHFYRRAYRAGISDADLRDLENRLGPDLETWEERLRRMVFHLYRSTKQADGPGQPARSAIDIWAKYGACFTESYWGNQPPEAALGDIALMERIEAEGLQVEIRRVKTASEQYTALRTASDVKLILNDIVPVLERMSLRTTSRLADTVRPTDGTPVHITVFDIAGPGNEPLTDTISFERLGEIAHRVLTGRLSNDPLLGLGYRAGLDWRQIDLLITYRNYFVQVFRGHAARSVNDALLNHAECARKLIAYFEFKFQPDGGGDPEYRSTSVLPAIEQQYRELLDDVTNIQEDVILRLFLSLLKSTFRTNYYRPGRGAHIAIKIKSAAVENMPRPCPLYEIYVHGPGVEGIHLRGGMVARGGLRHSDRPDDFRTEVHGLQKTQQVKNAVIVPVGSKGGFVTRNYFAERERQEQEVRSQYETFISGLLDVTDNREGDRIVPPAGVLRYDGDDPYLVVAADKGTATFSDFANAISEKYGFWLGDAFASGGSNGYDHKKLAITARGAWVNVERHFRELGVNIREESITVAGIGDMAGDVFGNGMLLNDKMKLVAAFNHRHIFIDPDPDPAVSYAERKRMFNLPRSNWTDYTREAMSEGGAIFDRNAKAIRLSTQAQNLLGCGPGPISGPDLIRQVLKLNVDLLWFGGIGTYVKASHETHTDADDPANNNVRVDSAELRCKVIGEGANLAITREARTEFLLAGGLCNTDYIDNSAGVDCSDHEVNLKILFGRVLEHGAMSGLDERNQVLRDIEPEIAELVLRNNYLQSALVTMEQMRARRDGVESMITQLHLLESKGVLDRRSERIPGDDDLREVLQTGRGLPRTVLCSLISNTKNDLYQRVLESDIPDLPFFGPTLLGYFPQRIATRFGEHILNHPLRREIIATLVTNNLVNQGGTTFLNDLATESATPLRVLVLRYVKCNELIDGDKLRAATHELDNKVAAQHQYQALMEIEDTIRALVRWWNWNQDSWHVSSDAVESLKQGFAQATNGLLNGLQPAASAALEARKAELISRGFPTELAARIAALPLLRHNFLVLATSRQRDKPIDDVARAIVQIGDALWLNEIDAMLATSPRENSWENRFHSILEREAAGLRRDLTQRVFSSDADDALAAISSKHADRLRQIGDGVQAVRGMRNSQVPLFILFDEYRPMIAD